MHCWSNYNLQSCKIAPKGSESDNSEMCDLNKANLSTEAQNFPQSINSIAAHHYDAEGKIRRHETNRLLLLLNFSPSTPTACPKGNRWPRLRCEVFGADREMQTHLQRLKWFSKRTSLIKRLIKTSNPDEQQEGQKRETKGEKRAPWEQTEDKWQALEHPGLISLSSSGRSLGTWDKLQRVGSGWTSSTLQYF